LNRSWTLYTQPDGCGTLGPGQSLRLHPRPRLSTTACPTCYCNLRKIIFICKRIYAYENCNPPPAPCWFSSEKVKKPLSLHRESGLKPRNYLWIDFHKNRYIPLLPRNIYFLWQHGWFPDLWLTALPKKDSFSGCKHPNGILSFSSSITVMAVASDFHRYFPILLCFHRHHIANYSIFIG